jgi:hypothetical protein
MNVSFTIFDPLTGEIDHSGNVSDETFEYYVTSGAHAILDVEADKRTHYVRLTDLEIVEYTEEERVAIAAIKPGWVWQMPERVAVDARELADTKMQKNAEINQKRLAANKSSFLFAGKSIACDELSMIDIQAMNGMILLINGLPPGFDNQWKAMDNTYVSIPDKAAWIAFYGAMVATGQSNFDHAQELKSALAAATTTAEVDAISWEA